MSDLGLEYIDEDTVCKYSLSPRGYKRLTRELDILNLLTESPYVPRVISYTHADGHLALVMSRVNGKSAKDWIGLKNDYILIPKKWQAVRKNLLAYVTTEMDLLGRGALYRDLNLEHLIFDDTKAFLVDHEATITQTLNGVWRQHDMTGTWETMAPEEFPEYAQLSTRTATYRVAVVAHLFLTGSLPFARYRYSRARTYAWRRKHPPLVSPLLPMQVRRIFKIALSLKEDRRYKDPKSFFNALAAAYGINHSTAT